MARPNWVYPILQADNPGTLPSYSHQVEWNVEPGSPVLSPLSGELIEWDTRSWPDDPYKDEDLGELFSAKVLTVVDGKRVINVIGPILYRYGTGISQPNKGDAIYRGQELGESADMPDRANLSWTAYLNDKDGGRFVNPLELAKKMGSVVEYYDDPALSPEYAGSVPPENSQPPQQKKNSGAIGLLLILGVSLAAKRWAK